MKKNIAEIFNPSSKSNSPLFILEMANNHMGDVQHGLHIIDEFAKVVKPYNFHFAFKLQFRDIPTFIHPDYINRKDIKYVKRFSETALSDADVMRLKKRLEFHGFISICTPFDESSVDRIVRMGFDIIKIGSCSINDWPLLERIAKTEKPIIGSVAGIELDAIDRVVSFFQHRNKKFVIMHCVGEYPTLPKNLQLNQIELFRKRYPQVVFGYSTHEQPDNYDAIKLAIAKGSRVFEKHVAIMSKSYEVNAYSAIPDQVSHWLEAAQMTYSMLGVVNKRAPFTKKEISDLTTFKRGLFAKKNIQKGEKLDQSNTFLAFPNENKQILADELSKYIVLIAKTNILKYKPVKFNLVSIKNTREDVLSIVKHANKILIKNNIKLNDNADIEISHHYGIGNFYKYGGVLISLVNREYCKKLIIMFKGQKHPEQYHNKKEETFNIISGEFQVKLDGKSKKLVPGDILTIERKVKHSMCALTDGIIEEISSTHYIDDSFYTDKKVTLNKLRKTHLTYWLQ